MRVVNLNTFSAVWVLIMALAVPAGAVTHYVSPGQSIQAAINAASNGDEIEVSPGTYYESATYSAAIDLMGKAIRLYSSGGPGVTAINGNGRYHAVLCGRGEGPDTILEGFTVTGGRAIGYDIHNYGGGMLVIQSSPTVTNCKFIGNSASEGGGGMYNMTNSNPTVTNCTFTGNSAGLFGGGMLNGGSNPIVTNCMFRGNSGGGVSNLSSSPTVTNCTFSGNTGYYCGGIYNNGSYPTVTNCILWGDSPTEIFNSSSSANVTYSDVQGGWAGTGNIDADPCFVDAAGGNCRLRDWSPCVDAGNINAVPAGVTTDLDGNPRFFDDASMPDTGYGTAPIVDMGAYERQTGSVGPIINVTQGLYYLQIQPAINGASNGDEIEVSPGTYNESIDFKGSAVRVYSSGGPEITTIDGTGHYHVVRCVIGEGPSTILEGFTITGGNANGTDSDNGGGGMYNNNSRATVTNCKFTGNRAGNGAGMLNMGSSPTLTNCTFSGNSAAGFMRGFGGGMYNTGSSPKVINCTFSGNTAREDGGGMYNIFNSNPTVTNCILWDDRPDEIFDGDIFSSSKVSYSDIQGGWGGAGNIDADPCFVDADNPDPNPRSLRLKPDSPCIDIGDNSAANPATTDIDGHPRILDGDCDDVEEVDMGAYEFNYAYTGDLDYSCSVDFFDFSIFGRAWETKEGDAGWDWACDIGDPPDGYISWRDVAILCDNWLTSLGP